MKFNDFYDVALNHVAGLVDSAFAKMPLLERCLNPDYMKLMFALGVVKHEAQNGERKLLDEYVPLAQKLGIVDAARENVNVDAMFAGFDQVLQGAGKIKVFGIALTTEDVAQFKSVLKGAGA